MPLDPLDYPFGIPRDSFAINGKRVIFSSIGVWTESSVERDRLVAAFPGLEPEKRPMQLVGLLTCGSNASPRRLSQKLSGAACPAAYAVRLRLGSWIPVYAATMSDYGAIPATFEWQAGIIAEPFLLVIDTTSLSSILETEFRSDNYDLYAVPAASVGLEVDYPLFAFVAKHGALRLNGEPIRLSEFEPPNAGSSQVSQEKLLKRLLSEIDNGMSFSDFRKSLKDRDQLATLRLQIVEKYGCAPKVPGWKKIDVRDRQGFAIAAAVGAPGGNANQGQENGSLLRGPG